MKRYLAIPRFDPAASEIEAFSADYSPAGRALRIDAMKEFRAKSIEDVVPKSGYESLEKTGVAKVLASPLDRTTFSGISILECDAQRRDDLQNEMPDHLIIEDTKLSLVMPQTTALGVEDAADADTWHLDAIGLDNARKRGFRGAGDGIGVAVLDTGITEVPELEGRVTETIEFDRDLQLVAADTPVDTFGHGTHVAGLIAGKTVGVAPEADLLNVTMIPRNQGTCANFVLAMDFVLSKPTISIANISAGLDDQNEGLRQSMRALVRAGVLPVVAIGNSGPDTSRSPGNFPEALSVGASNVGGKLWVRSSGGTMILNSMSFPVPDMVAPGENVMSCLMQGGFNAWSGTSMATPIVSGVAALILERYPNIGEADLRQEILSTCSPLPNAVKDRQGAGLVQVPTHLWFKGA